MKKRLILNTLILILLVGCTLNSKERHHNKYDIEINYNYFKEIKPYVYDYMDKRYRRDGNIHLIFETDFNKDSVTISVNNEPKYQDVITTDASTGTAKSYKIENIEKVYNIGIRINNGKQALIEVDTMNLFTVEYRDSLLKIDILDHVPVYY